MSLDSNTLFEERSILKSALRTAKKRSRVIITCNLILTFFTPAAIIMLYNEFAGNWVIYLAAAFLIGWGFFSFVVVNPSIITAQHRKMEQVRTHYEKRIIGYLKNFGVQKGSVYFEDPLENCVVNINCTIDDSNKTIIMSVRDEGLTFMLDGKELLKQTVR